MNRAYLQALSRGGSATPKVILAATNTEDVILLNFEEKLRPDLLDMQVPAPKTK
jgi:hypothetical protein